MEGQSRPGSLAVMRAIHGRHRPPATGQGNITEPLMARRFRCKLLEILFNTPGCVRVWPSETVLFRKEVFFVWNSWQLCLLAVFHCNSIISQ